MESQDITKNKTGLINPVLVSVIAFAVFAVVIIWNARPVYTIESKSVLMSVLMSELYGKVYSAEGDILYDKMKSQKGFELKLMRSGRTIDVIITDSAHYEQRKQYLIEKATVDGSESIVVYKSTKQ